MRFVRTILAFAIAASLALLPLGASAAVFGMPGGDTHQEMQMNASSDAAMDCCPDDLKGVPFHKDGYKCGTGVCCAGGLVTLGDVRSIAFRFVPTPESRIAIPAGQVITVNGGTALFRPPRV